MNAMAPSHELSEAVVLALAFAERGCLPERPACIVTSKATLRRLTDDDFLLLEPRILAGMADLYDVVDTEALERGLGLQAALQMAVREERARKRARAARLSGSVAGALGVNAQSTRHPTDRGDG